MLFIFFVFFLLLLFLLPLGCSYPCYHDQEGFHQKSRGALLYIQECLFTA